MTQELMLDMFYAAPELWYVLLLVFLLLLGTLFYSQIKILKLTEKNYFINRDRERYAETLYASRNKTVKHTYTVTGSATVEFGYASLGLTNTYTYENSKSTGGGTSKKVPARHYVGFYVGHPMDVFNVDVVKTTKIHCPWCGKLQKTTTKKFCYQAKVPLKTKTLYWKSLTNKKNSFSNVIIEK